MIGNPSLANPNPLTSMESTLISSTAVPPWDDSLMRAIGHARASSSTENCLSFGIEGADGHVYRVVRTNGVCEAAKFFESARELGFRIVEGREDGEATFHRVLRRIH